MGQDRPLDLEVSPGHYRHYKGRDYQVLGVARHSETEEPMVVYRCLYGDYSLWVRPLAVFLETVSIGEAKVPRFSRAEHCRAHLEPRIYKQGCASQPQCTGGKA